MLESKYNKNQLLLTERQTNIIENLFMFTDKKEKISAEYTEKLLFRILESKKFKRMFIDTIKQQKEAGLK